MVRSQVVEILEAKMKPTKAELERALRIAIKSIITGEYTGCYDVCTETFDTCPIKYSKELQIKKCVEPIRKHLIKLAQVRKTK